LVYLVSLVNEIDQINQKDQINRDINGLSNQSRRNI